MISFSTKPLYLLFNKATRQKNAFKIGLQVNAFLYVQRMQRSKICSSRSCVNLGCLFSPIRTNTISWKLLMLISTCDPTSKLPWGRMTWTEQNLKRFKRCAMIQSLYHFSGTFLRIVIRTMFTECERRATQFIFVCDKTALFAERHWLVLKKDLLWYQK